MKGSRPKFVVGIGGSAGGLNAYKALLDALPANSGMAFVIVSHILPTANSQLASILSRHTRMPVSVACAAMPVFADRVYVCPPNADLRVEGHQFRVVSPRNHRNVAVDVLFTSLAEAVGARAVGIVLSGYDGDGTEGCRQIKAKGGITFAQDTSADVGDMPLSAQAAGCIDFVLSPGQISRRLQAIGQSGRGMTIE